MNAQPGAIAGSLPPRYPVRLKGEAEVNVYEWAMGARIGERVSYFTAFHAGTQVIPAARRGPAQQASKEGLVFLAQRRVHNGFRYEATRISIRTAKLLGLIGPRAELFA